MDMNDAPANRAVVHRGGLNALYADWSVKQTRTARLTRHINLINTWELQIPSGAALRGRRYAHFQLWLELDRS